jgi:membrane protein required for colicin V production
MSTNIFDLIIAGVLIWSAYKGFSKGIISAAATLIALLVGVWGAVQFSNITSSYLTGVINVDEKVLGIIAFALTFILIVIGVHFVAKAIEGLANAVALGFINKLFGAVFGVMKTAFIISIILVFVNTINNSFHFLSNKFKEESVLYKPISKLAPWTFNYLDFNKIKEETKKKNLDIDI